MVKSTSGFRKLVSSQSVFFFFFIGQLEEWDRFQPLGLADASEQLACVLLCLFFLNLTKKVQQLKDEEHNTVNVRMSTLLPAG